MYILDRYIIKTVCIYTFLFLFTILALYSFIALVDAFKHVGKASFATSDAFYYIILTLPIRIYELFPVSVLLGSMMGLGTMNSNNEIIAFRTAGVSVTRIIFSAMKAAFILALFMFAIGDYIVPETQKLALSYWTKKSDSAASAITDNAIWVRDKDTFIKIHSISTNKDLGKVSIFAFKDDKTLKSSTLAESAHFKNNNWILKDIKQTFFTESKVIVSEMDEALWPKLFDPEMLDVIVSKLEHLSTRDLYRYVSYLDDNNLDSNKYWLLFWNKIISPFSIAAMLLISIPFVFNNSRTSNAGNRLMAGVMIGVVFTISNKITAQFGLVSNFSPFLSASIITIATLIFASILIRRI